MRMFMARRVAVFVFGRGSRRSHEGAAILQLRQQEVEHGSIFLRLHEIHDERRIAEFLRPLGSDLPDPFRGTTRMCQTPEA